MGNRKHGRYEWVQKSVEELALETLFGHNILFPLNAFTMGFDYRLLRVSQTNIAVGAQGTFFHATSSLDRLYGANPLSAELYVRISPGIMKM